MPTPRRLATIPCSTSRFTPFNAVAGLMRWNAASSLIEGIAASSATAPSMMSFSMRSAICRKIGRVSSIRPRFGCLVSYFTS